MKHTYLTLNGFFQTCTAATFKESYKKLACKYIYYKTRTIVRKANHMPPPKSHNIKIEQAHLHYWLNNKISSM